MKMKQRIIACQPRIIGYSRCWMWSVQRQWSDDNSGCWGLNENWSKIFTNVAVKWWASCWSRYLW